MTRVQARRERAALSLRFPRVAGYRTELPDDRFSARFGEDSHFELTPDLTGPCTTRLEGRVGEGHDLTPAMLDATRPAAIALHVTKRLIETHFAETGAPPPYHLCGKLQPITRAWMRDCLVLKGGTKAGMLTYAEIADLAAEKIYQAKTRLWATDPDKSPIDWVVGDSDWELEVARVIEAHPATLSYVKNQGLGFEVPYRLGGESRIYRPDFLLRLDDGGGAGDPLHLVVEMKGFRGLDAAAKASTMHNLWVPGVNRLKSFGRWRFAEFRDAFALEEQFGRLLAELRRHRGGRVVAGGCSSEIALPPIAALRDAAFPEARL